jgi:hypothetical protein
MLPVHGCQCLVCSASFTLGWPWLLRRRDVHKAETDIPEDVLEFDRARRRDRNSVSGTPPVSKASAPAVEDAALPFTSLVERTRSRSGGPATPGATPATSQRSSSRRGQPKKEASSQPEPITTVTKRQPQDTGMALAEARPLTEVVHSVVGPGPGPGPRMVD